MIFIFQLSLLPARKTLNMSEAIRPSGPYRAVPRDEGLFRADQTVDQPRKPEEDCEFVSLELLLTILE